jgi:uncharacterized membrane protein YkvA (DUF1232 family)
VPEHTLACLTLELLRAESSTRGMSLISTVYRARKDLWRVFPLLRDERVPLLLKVGAIAGAVLIVSPIDLFGDIPGLGMVDDAILLAILATVFVRVATHLTQRNVTERNVSPQPGTSLALE